MVICLERGADDLHMVHLIDTTATPSSLVSLKSRLVSPFWYHLALVVLEKRRVSVCTADIHIVCDWVIEWVDT